MTIGLLKDIADHYPRGKSLLGLDVGKKTLGLALADPALSVVTPLQTIRRTKFTQDMQALAVVVKEFGVCGFIVGLPLNMDGSAGRQAQSVHDFAHEMLKHPAVVGVAPWIALWDERLSTSAVRDFVDNHVHKKSTRQNAKESGLIDRLAAQVILQGAVDFLRAYAP